MNTSAAGAPGPTPGGTPQTLACARHGRRPAAVVCGHIVRSKDRPLGFVENSSDPDDLQAWCNRCETYFVREAGMSEAFRTFCDPAVVCSACYLDLKAFHAQPVP